jgi:hypothetical protein
MLSRDSQKWGNKRAYTEMRNWLQFKTLFDFKLTHNFRQQPSGREEPLRGRRHGRDRQYIKGHFRQVWEVPPLLRIAPPLNRVLKIVMGRGSDISLIFVAGRSCPKFLVSRASKGRPLWTHHMACFPCFHSVYRLGSEGLLDCATGAITPGILAGW